MRKNFGAKPYTYPQPVLIIASYGEDGTADAMNAAWGGISDDTQISMCLSAGHKNSRKYSEAQSFYSEHGRRRSCNRVRLCRRGICQ